MLIAPLWPLLKVTQWHQFWTFLYDKNTKQTSLPQPVKSTFLKHLVRAIKRMNWILQLWNFHQVMVYLFTLGGIFLTYGRTLTQMDSIFVFKGFNRIPWPFWEQNSKYSFADLGLLTYAHNYDFSSLNFGFLNDA